MLPIKRRIKKESFTEIVKGGVFVHLDSFYLIYLDRKDNLPSRFSFVVSSKVNKTSVGRHLLKRRMTKVVEERLLEVKFGFSCLVYAKKGASSLLYSELKTEILKLLIKSKLLN